MLKFVIQILQKMEFADEQIYMTIESKMKRGLGKRVRCNAGKDFICTKRTIILERMPHCEN